MKNLQTLIADADALICQVAGHTRESAQQRLWALRQLQRKAEAKAAAIERELTALDDVQAVRR